MKRFIALLMGCSLALAANAFAQQPQEQGTPTKQQGGKGHRETTEQSTQPPAKQQHAGKKGSVQNAGSTNPATTNAEATPQRGRRATREGRRGKAGANETNANATPNEKAAANASATPTGKQARQGKRGRNKANQPETTNASGAGAAGAGAAGAGAAGAAATSPAPAATAGVQANTANANAQGRGGRGRKLDTQTVQNIKSQHTNFRAQPKPQQAPAVTFNQGYRIQGAEQWQGPQYEVFRSYHPEQHDQGWYRSHYNRIELIGGGYYYWNNGYWFPAWGYSPSESYYAWDGPIYVGARAERPDQVIADVQAVLQQEGYYKGEVDGLLGPLTREALTEYQRENGLYATAAIDEPTLQSLGLS